MAFEYFTEAELRALPQMSDTAKFPTTRCDAAAAHIVAIIEREVGTSFIARTVTDETHDGTGEPYILLNQIYVQSVTTAEIDGVAVTDHLAASSGLLYRYTTGAGSPSTWPAGVQNVRVTYEAGYSAAPPADVKEAALKGTRAHLLSTMANSAMDDRRTSLSTDMGTVSFVVAGQDHPTGYPDVDAVILAWRSRLNVLGFA